MSQNKVNQNRIKQIGLIVISVLILIGVALMLWSMLTDDDRNNIDVDLSDGVSDAVLFEDLCLIPGDEASYRIRLKNDNAKQYELRLDFVEKGTATLKDFARVKVVNGEKVIYDEILATAFASDDIAFEVDFSREKNTELLIVYYLPLDIGNEAKSTEAVFELIFTAINE